MTLSVVLCAYTEARWAMLTAAIESVLRQSHPPCDLIVVIDHNEALLARMRSAYPDVTLLANTGQRGLAAARNTGISAARGDIVAFLDDDAVADESWLERLRAGYISAEILGVGGAIQPDWACGRPKWFPAEFNWVVGCSYRGMPRSTAPVRNLIGANMSFRREVFALIGGFRGELGRVGAGVAGCEETEFCIRLQQSRPGGVILYEPAARVCHHVPGARSTWRYFIARCYGEGGSKALVAAGVGTADGLASERAYTFRVLPRAVARGIWGAAARRDAAGLLRAGAVVSGLLVTTIGYASGRVGHRIGIIRSDSERMLRRGTGGDDRYR